MHAGEIAIAQGALEERASQRLSGDERGRQQEEGRQRGVRDVIQRSWSRVTPRRRAPDYPR